MKTPEDEEFERMAKMQEWKTNELHKCTACSTQYSEDEGGIEGNFGILPMNFCPTCLSCMLDMADQLNHKEWEGLTSEDMKDPRTHNLDFIHGARWAEEILKERNYEE
jgi:hypothetical protein